MDPSAITPESLSILLSNIFKPDTQLIRDSTQALKKAFEFPQIVQPLLVILSGHAEPQIRLLACICLKKRISFHWEAQSAEIKTMLKAELLSRYEAETSGKVKENIAYLMGTLSALLVPKKEWPELLEYITARCMSDSLAQMELGSMILQAIAEALGNAIEPYMATFAQILTRLIEVKNASIQMNVVRAINCMTTSNITTDSLMKLSPLIPYMFAPEMLKNEALLYEMLDNFSELVDLQKFLVPHLPTILPMAMQIAGNTGFSRELRKVALLMVQSACYTKSKHLKKNKELLQKIFELAFVIACEPEEGYEEDEETVVDAVLDVFEQYSVRIPNKVIYPLFMSGVEKFLQSPEPHCRKGALLILGTISKGVEDSMKKQIDKIIEVVLKYISDSNVLVQEAAIVALCYLSDNLTSSIVEYHKKILPPLLDAFKAKSEKVRTRVFYAIETFVEELNEKDIIPFLQPLLESLLFFLNDPNMEIKRNVVLALNSTIMAARKNIVPYFDVLFARLSELLFGASSQDELLRGKATMAIGKLAFSAGIEKFAPHLETISQKVLADIKSSKIFEMSEAGYSYFGDIAKLLGKDFAKMLPLIVPLALEACTSSDGIHKEYQEKKKDDFAIVSDEEDDAELKGVTVRTAFLDEKTAALHMLGMIAISCPKEFLEYMPASLETLEKLWNYFNESVRIQVMQTYQQFVEGLNLAYYGTEAHPTPIHGLPPKVKMSDDATKLYFETVLPKFIHHIKTDEDKEVVIVVLEAIADLANTIGPAVIDTKLPEYVECILLLLNRKAACQNEDSDGSDSEDSEEEDFDNDEILMGNLFEMIESIARVCGDAVIPYYQPVFEALLKYLKPSRTEEEWANTIGSLAELFRVIPSILPTYYQKILQLCLKYCESGYDTLSWNGAYCLGIMVEYGKDLFVPYLDKILHALKTAYDSSKTQDPKDNCISSLLRVMVAHPDKVPLAMILPAIFQNIPLNSDLEENIDVMKSLLKMSPDLIKNNSKYVENTLLTCIRVIVDPYCLAEEDAKQLSGNCLGRFSKIPEIYPILAAIIEKMNPIEKAEVQKYVK